MVDASAAVAALLRDGPARALLSEQQLHTAHLADTEIAHTLRRLVARGDLSADAGEGALRSWSGLALIRHPGRTVLDRVRDLRENVSAYDATYVALAEALDCTLVTADARLARAYGPACTITVVPH